MGISSVQTISGVGRVNHFATGALQQVNRMNAVGERVSIFTIHPEFTFTKNATIELDKDWVTDVLFDFTALNVLDILTYQINADAGVKIIANRKETVNSVLARIAFGKPERKKTVSCLIASVTGEKRDMTLNINWV